MKPHHARKRFGQHFLIDPNVIDTIVHAIGPTKADTVVEIGPGLAAITAPLLARAGRMHLIELDRDLVVQLRKRFGNQESVEVHEADALKFDFSTLAEQADGQLRIVGNLPYNISTPLLFHLLGFRAAIRDMHFMLQKEVVDRMAASPGGKDYGRLGIMLGCYFSIDPLLDVEPDAFDPPPAVRSAVVRLTPLPADSREIRNPAALSRLVASAFSQRRKTVRNALRGIADESVLEAVGIDPGLRPEMISIDEYVRLSNTLE